LLDSVCKSWFSCLLTCPDNACAFMCDQMYPNSAKDGMYQCACSSCPSECGLYDPCSH
jgi:hypothetical protein